MVSSEALANEGTLWRGVADGLRGATAGKPWGSTSHGSKTVLVSIPYGDVSLSDISRLVMV